MIVLKFHTSLISGLMIAGGEISRDPQHFLGQPSYKVPAKRGICCSDKTPVLANINRQARGQVSRQSVNTEDGEDVRMKSSGYRGCG